jgi:hypothetical protein
MIIGMRLELEAPTRITLVGAFFLAFCVLGCGGGGGAGGGPGSSGGAGSGGTGGGPVAGAGGSGGAGAGGGGSGGRADASGDSSGGGGLDTGVSSGDAMAVPSGVACEPRASLTLAIHIIVNVGWDGSLGTNPGTGEVHLWNLAKMTVNGTTLTGMTQPCGNTLPPLSLRPLVGGGMALVEVPNAVWGLPTAP